MADLGLTGGLSDLGAQVLHSYIHVFIHSTTSDCLQRGKHCARPRGSSQGEKAKISCLRLTCNIGDTEGKRKSVIQYDNEDYGEEVG